MIANWRKLQMAEISASLVKALRDKTNAGMMDCKKALMETNGDLEAAVDWLRKKGLSAAAKRSGRIASEGLIGVAVSGTRGAIVEVNSETDFVARNAIFQDFVATVARIAVDLQGDPAAIKQSTWPASGRPIGDELTHLAATIGENITLRRADALSVEEGIIASYVHSAQGPGIGRIGVLVALEADRTDQAVADLGKKLAMHVAAANPLAVSRADVAPDALDRERAILVEQARASGKPEPVVQKMVEGRLAKFYEDVCLLEQAFVMDPQTKINAVLEAASRELGCRLHVRRFIRYALGEGVEERQDDVTAAA
jgi:elongation factor Ts